MATVKPLVYRPTLGHAGPPAPGDTIDPVYIPPVTATTQRTFAFFAG